MKLFAFFLIHLSIMGQDLKYKYTKPTLNPKITFCKEIFKNNVKEAKAINYILDTNKTKLIESGTINWNFDDYGRLKSFSYNSSGNGTKFKYYYSKENLIEEEEYNIITDELYYKTVYNYNENNRYFEKTIFRNKELTQQEKEIFHYRHNEDQPYKKEVATENEMELLEYDSNNNLCQIVSENRILFFEYDDKRRIIKEGILIKKSEKIIDKTYFEYNYLDDRILMYDFRNSKKQLCLIYFLNNNGKVIKIENYYDGEIYDEERFKYDSKNNLIEHLYDGKTNRENSLIEYLYEYDSYDNVLTKTTKKENLIIEMEKFDYKYL